MIPPGTQMVKPKAEPQPSKVSFSATWSSQDTGMHKTLRQNYSQLQITLHTSSKITSVQAHSRNKNTDHKKVVLSLCSQMQSSLQFMKLGFYMFKLYSIFFLNIILTNQTNVTIRLCRLNYSQKINFLHINEVFPGKLNRRMDDWECACLWCADNCCTGFLSFEL